MTTLIMSRGRELGHLHVSRVERLYQALDRTAFAGRVPALEDHTNRRSEAIVGYRLGVIERALTAERKPQLTESGPTGLEAASFLSGIERQRKIEFPKAGQRFLIWFPERRSPDAARVDPG